MILTSLEDEKQKVENLIFHGLNEIFSGKKISKYNIEYYISELDDFLNAIRSKNIIYDYDIDANFSILLDGEIRYWLSPDKMFKLEFKG